MEVDDVELVGRGGRPASSMGDVVRRASRSQSGSRRSERGQAATSSAPGLRVAAGEQRDLVAVAHQLLGQIGDDPLGTPVELRRHALIQGSDLGDAQFLHPNGLSLSEHEHGGPNPFGTSEAKTYKGHTRGATRALTPPTPSLPTPPTRPHRERGGFKEVSMEKGLFFAVLPLLPVREGGRGREKRAGVMRAPAQVPFGEVGPALLPEDLKDTRDTKDIKDEEAPVLAASSCPWCPWCPWCPTRTRRLAPPAARSPSAPPG